MLLWKIWINHSVQSSLNLFLILSIACVIIITIMIESLKILSKHFFTILLGLFVFISWIYQNVNQYCLGRNSSNLEWIIGLFVAVAIIVWFPWRVIKKQFVNAWHIEQLGIPSPVHCNIHLQPNDNFETDWFKIS